MFNKLITPWYNTNSAPPTNYSKHTYTFHMENWQYWLSDSQNNEQSIVIVYFRNFVTYLC